MNTTKKFEDFVNVSVRIKPKLESDAINNCLEVISKNPAVLFSLDKQQTYYFDNIFTDDFNQKEVFEESVKPLVQKVKEGYNCTVFAYGQTGTGKTYTMGTNPMVANEADEGLVPRTLVEFFDDTFSPETEISVSFIEIYNEKVFDLLQSHSSLALPVKGFNVHGVKQESVSNYFEGKHFLDLGGRNRHTGETKQNLSSSRSHAIFTVYCTIRHGDNGITTAKLNLVDLAGSESVRKTGNRGSTFHEGVNINKGLLCIGQVMTALSSNANYIPYRQSMITTILQDSLNKRNYVSLIACISNSTEDSTETSQTLEFAHRVKKMRNKPEVNQVIIQYKKEHPVLFERATKISGTPLKRPNAQVFQTPLPVKKRPHDKLSTVCEAPANSTMDSPKSLFSMSVSTIASCEQNQQNFSPVIKKYINAMEESLMEKFHAIITNTLRKKTPQAVEEHDKENNTPKLTWNSVRNEVSKIVREEVLQFSTVVRATSSPIDGAVLVNTRRVLDYDLDANLLETEKKCNEACYDECETEPQITFKVPQFPAKIRKNKTPTRRSVRISRREPINMNTSRSYKVSPEMLSKREQPVKRTPLKRVSGVNKARKSVRLQRKVGKRVSEPKSVQVTDKTVKNHNKEVLEILNSGDVRKMCKLHGIGLKTADRIAFFRKLKGEFKCVSDLSEMPAWSEKKHSKFLSENFIHEE